MDKTENEKNMNRIVFSGIEIHDLWADDLNWAQRLDKIKSAITNFIKIIKPDLGYVRHLNFKNFPDDVKGTSIGPSLTLATRVRIAILHALAKEIKASKEDTDAWVIQHVARPVVKIKLCRKMTPNPLSPWDSHKQLRTTSRNYPTPICPHRTCTMRI